MNFHHILSILIFVAVITSCNGQKQVVKGKPAAESKTLQVPDVKGMVYDSARVEIIEAGWLPNKQDAEKAKAPGGVASTGLGKFFWEKGYHEVDACSGTGMAPCQFIFKHKEQTLYVTTHGEEAIVKEIWTED